MYTLHSLEELVMSTTLPALYSVLLLPRRELVARGLTLRDASAWMRTYNEALQGSPYQAVIAEEASLKPKAASRTAA